MEVEVPDISYWEETDSELAKYTICKLQEENKTLNEVIETLKETNHLLINQKYKLEYELDFLDSKRDKAIEYIEDNMSYVVKGNKEYIPSGEELLDILRGKDE